MATEDFDRTEDLPDGEEEFVLDLDGDRSPAEGGGEDGERAAGGAVFDDADFVIEDEAGEEGPRSPQGSDEADELDFLLEDDDGGEGFAGANAQDETFVVPDDENRQHAGLPASAAGDTVDGAALAELEEEIFGDVEPEPAADRGSAGESAAPAGREEADDYEKVEELLFDDAEELDAAAEKNAFPTPVDSFSEEGGGLEGLDHFDPTGAGSKGLGLPSAEEKARWGDSSIFGEDEELELVADEAAEPFMQESGTFDAIADEDEELEIVGDAKELLGLESHAGTAATPPDEPGGEREAGDEGEPEEVEDPIYGKEAPVPAGGFVAPEAGPDTRELRKILPEEEVVGPRDEPVVVGAPVQRAWPRRFMAAGIAASLLVLVGVGVLAFAPRSRPARELRRFLGLRPLPADSGILVTEVSRPRIETAEPLPFRPPADRRPAPGGAPAGGPKTARVDRRAVLEHLRSLASIRILPGPRFWRLFAEGYGKAAAAGRAAVKPVIAAGTETPAPAVPAPTVPRPGPAPVAGVGPQPPSPPAGPVGPEPKPKTEARRGVELAEGEDFVVLMDAIHRGTQAFAKLKNGNFFIGRVRKIAPQELILQIEHGEVSLRPHELRKVVPLAQSELRLLRRANMGIVRLKNREKIRGTILEDLEDYITIETEGSRIFLPRSSIDSISRKEEGKIVVGKDADWLDQAVKLPVPESDTGPMPLPTPEEGDDDDPSRAVRIQVDPLPKPGGTPAAPPKGR